MSVSIIGVWCMEVIFIIDKKEVAIEIADDATLGALKAELLKFLPTKPKDGEVIVVSKKGTRFFSDSQNLSELDIKTGDKLGFSIMTNERALQLKEQSTSSIVTGQPKTIQNQPAARIRTIEGKIEELDRLPEGYKHFPELKGISLNNDLTSRFTYTGNYVFFCLSEDMAKEGVGKYKPVALDDNLELEDLASRLESSKYSDTNYKVNIKSKPKKLEDGIVIEYTLTESFCIKFKDITGNTREVKCNKDDPLATVAKQELKTTAAVKIWPPVAKALENGDYTGHFCYTGDYVFVTLNDQVIQIEIEDVFRSSEELLREAIVARLPVLGPNDTYELLMTDSTNSIGITAQVKQLANVQPYIQQKKEGPNTSPTNFDGNRLLLSLTLGGTLGLISYGAKATTALGEKMLSDKVCIGISIAAALLSYALASKGPSVQK